MAPFSLTFRMSATSVAAGPDGSAITELAWARPSEAVLGSGRRSADRAGGSTRSATGRNLLSGRT